MHEVQPQDAVTVPARGHDWLHRLRPRRTLFWQGVIACAAFLTPVFAVLYVLTVPTGDGWWIVASMQALATGLIVLAAARFFLATIWVGEGGIAERGYLSPRRHFPIGQVASIVRARTFGHGAEVIDQLFVCDAEGRCLVRMRGQFWWPRDLDAVVDTLGIPVTVLPEVMTLRELAAGHPNLVYWFERF